MDDTVKFLRRFGSEIHIMRKDRGLTQKEFAKVTGISPSYIASIESGRRWPHINILYAIANNLETTPHELIKIALKEPTYE
ncbi:MAG: DNA-binding protein [Candidatus Saccharibacteria bacterium]|nr:DNA-binding protein [Candidatus Saccharibacteria bacterium]